METAHEFTLLATITAAFVCAAIFGMVAVRLRLPPLVGYLVAGVALGPFTPGFVGNGPLAGELAEIGVILLMFGVGLHFSVSDLLAVRWIAVPGAVGQIVIATAIGIGMAMGWGWSWGAGLTLGLSVSVASTVVLLKALEERGSVATPDARIAIGWLIVEDLAMVLALVLLPAFAGSMGGHAPDSGHAPAAAGELALTIAVTLGKVLVFAVLFLKFGARVLPWLLRCVARTGSRELFTLTVLGIALGIAFGSAKLFGVSFALGAFFAGMVLSESDFSHKAASNSLPLQDAFSVLFFVSVGMLFDPSILLRQPLKVGEVLGLIIVGKTLAAVAIVLLLRFPWRTALVIGASLAQIGEFSFILGGLGVRLGILNAEGFNLILAGALFSITLNPLVFALVDRVLAAAPWRHRMKSFGAGRFEALRQSLAAARLRAEQRTAAHKALNPLELAERFPLFVSLTPDQREVLALHFRPHSAQPGERIVRAGDRADSVYFISLGSVQAVLEDQTLSLGAGGYFGEIELLHGRPRLVDVTAVDYTELLALDRRDFLEFLRKYPDLRARINTLASEREKSIPPHLAVRRAG